MRPRIVLARLLIKIGRFIETAALMVMKPDDLIEYSRQTYAREQCISSWSKTDLVDSGLKNDEKELFNKLPLKQGRLLLLGLGGGREAIYFAKVGFQVTGVDFIPEMAEQAKKNTTRHDLAIESIVQDISRLDVKSGIFDVVWLSAAMYSCVPTKKKRIDMLKRISKALQPDGFFICQFHWGSDKPYSSKKKIAGKILAWITLGNISYEPGDMLWHNIEFIHGFLSAEELKQEFYSGGCDIIHLYIPEQSMRGGAVLKKNEKKAMPLIHLDKINPTL